MLKKQSLDVCIRGCKNGNPRDNFEKSSHYIVMYIPSRALQSHCWFDNKHVHVIQGMRAPKVSTQEGFMLSPTFKATIFFKVS